MSKLLISRDARAYLREKYGIKISDNALLGWIQKGVGPFEPGFVGDLFEVNGRRLACYRSDALDMVVTTLGEYLRPDKPGRKKRLRF